MKKLLLAISALVIFASCQREQVPDPNGQTPQVSVIDSSFLTPEEFARHIDIQTMSLTMMEVPSIVETLKEISISAYNKKISQTMQKESGFKSPDWGYRRFILRYRSIDGAGKPIYLSEVLIFPEAKDFKHSISKIHLCNPYTNTLATLAPSSDDEYAFAMSAAQDAVFIAPDSQGFGESSNRDMLFISLKLQAQQTMDGLVAALEFLKHQNIELTQERSLVNWGYSLGAGTALAFHRIYEGLDKDAQERLGSLQSLCASGPYNIPRTLKWMEEQKELSYPLSLPLAVCGLKESQPDLLNAYSVESFFSSAFNNAGIIDMIRSRRYVSSYVSSVIQTRVGASWSNITSQDMNNHESEQYQTLMQAIDNEDILNGWRAAWPVTLIHSSGDTFVPYFNAEDAVKSLGNQVELITLPDISSVEGHYVALPFVILKLMTL